MVLSLRKGRENYIVATLKFYTFPEVNLTILTEGSTVSAKA